MGQNVLNPALASFESQFCQLDHAECFGWKHRWAVGLKADDEVGGSAIVVVDNGEALRDMFPALRFGPLWEELESGDSLGAGGES